MARFNDRDKYLTRHLFGAGLECPVKLYYYRQGYPQNKQSRPFIEHAIYNKRLLTALVRSVYPDGILVDEKQVPKAADKTHQLLQSANVVLFDAVFEHKSMMARLPIVHKTGNKLTAFYIRTKAFDSRKHRITDANGFINSKWEKYILDFAYQVYLIQNNFPGLDIQAMLVMPEKSSSAYTDNLPLLLHPLDNSQKVVDVDFSNQELLAKLDVTEVVEKLVSQPVFAENYLPKPTLKETLKYFSAVYSGDDKPEPEVGLKCKNCEFRIEENRVGEGEKSGFNECWSPVMSEGSPSKNHIFDLIGPGTNRRLANGNYDQGDIPLDSIFSSASVIKSEGRISQEMRQALQVHKRKNEDVPEEIIRPVLFEELDRWEFPLHFLDFEAGNFAVPIRKNRTPYHLVVFQFSCHTLYQDGTWKHREWIDDLNSGYSNYELVRRLKDISDIEEGTIVQYSNFERHALKTIRSELLKEHDEISDAIQLVSWIEQLINRHDSSHSQPPYIADISRLVKNFYYNREMESSLSIKDVLRSVMSHSSYLKEIYSRPYSSSNFRDIIWWQPDGKGGAKNPYAVLTESGDSPIRRGTEAMVVYGKMIAQKLDPKKKQAYQNALLKYCELDTLAMMMIFQHWQEKMG
ncbi:hypothetical protein CK503_01315 [Aliifodinibius salipaludis]|uniref:DUF2779 domain-containing protein n=1 Tax=Fodinibius salipaludis TaxID=2032627 RepID=A0A2A2GED6_9BACT|nr:DUF2779 domain-containing protein [Aliifodinibius salipaludis]PAU95728.1 hypothetical protein CK503_01315 [Aliifodinibius salipaludis]